MKKTFDSNQIMLSISHAMASPLNLALNQNSNIAVLPCVQTTNYIEAISDVAYHSRLEIEFG